jgi:hypothetical protein
MENEAVQPTAEELTLTILSNMMALNIFIEMKYGEEGAALLEQLEAQVRARLLEDGNAN